MQTSNERTTYLFNRYYQKIATEQEQKELFLLMKDMSNEQLSGLMSQAFAVSGENLLQSDEAKTNAELNKILGTSSTVNPHRTKLISLWGRIAVAASILLIIGTAFYFFQTKKQDTVAQNSPKGKPANDAAPATNKAILTLADGTSIALDDAANGEVAKQGAIIVKKTADGKLVYTVTGSDSAMTPVAMNKIATPRGGQYQVALPDGTIAWLNAASSISFPTAFEEDKREVSMTGEVYFEVAKKGIPFFVSSAKGTVQVLGTHFNVMAYDDEAAMETTLLEGSIKIASGNTSGLLKPGQQARLSSIGNLKISSNVDTDEVMAWRTGLFNFNDADVPSVMRQLSRWYDVDVSYNGNIPEKLINGKISRNVKASEVLNMLSYTGINFKIEGKKIRVMP